MLRLRQSRVLLGIACLITMGAGLAMWFSGGPASDREIAAQIITPGPVANRSPGYSDSRADGFPAAADRKTGSGNGQSFRGAGQRYRNVVEPIQTAADADGPVIRPAGFTEEAAGPTATGAAEDDFEESWQVVYIGDQRVGWSHSTARTRTVDEETIISSESNSRMEVKRFGQKLVMETELLTDETDDGRLLSYSLTIRNPPNSVTTSRGEVRTRENPSPDGRQLQEMVLTTTTAGRTETKKIPWADDIRSPGWQDRVIREPMIRPGQTRSFKAFLPEFGQVGTIRITADEYRKIELQDGSLKELLQIRMVQSVLPTLTTRAWLDSNGGAVKTSNDFFGRPMVTWRVTAEEALKELEGGDLDLSVGTLVRVDPIRRPHETKEVVYRLTLPDGNPVASLSDGGTQSIREIDKETVELKVTSVRPGRVTVKKAVDPVYLRPTRFLQSRDPRVMEHARRAAAGTTDPARMAVQLEQYVSRRLENKNFSTALASAAEVAESLEGDCTEHAVLLAAMLRAVGIPSRIAVGLVYVESRTAFGGHMWTEAWLGDRWVPLDATLGRGGIGAAHIRMSVSSFADDAPAPVASFLPLMRMLNGLKIEVVSIDSARQ